jgi:hypothetical protein
MYFLKKFKTIKQNYLQVVNNINNTLCFLNYTNLNIVYISILKINLLMHCIVVKDVIFDNILVLNHQRFCVISCVINWSKLRE